MTIIADLKSHRGLIPEKLHPVGTMGVVTASAIKFLPGTRRVCHRFFLLQRKSQRVACRRKTGNSMRRLSHLGMAFKTEADGILFQQRHLLRYVRFMAAEAHAPFYRHMDIFLHKILLFVAVVAEVGDFFDEQFLMGRRMRGMTSRAAADTHRRMDRFPGKLCLIVTAITKVRLFGRKSPGHLVRFFMGHISGINAGVAGGTSHLDSSMDNLALGKFLMTHQAVRTRSKGGSYARLKTTGRKNKTGNNKKKQPIF